MNNLSCIPDSLLNGKPFIKSSQMPLFFKKSVNHLVIDINGSPHAYTSLDSLQNKALDYVGNENPKAYLDPEIYPYFVLGNVGSQHLYGMNLGDIAYVENADIDKCCCAVFVDVGDNDLTEGSLKLAKNLGFGYNDAKKHSFESAVHYKTENYIEKKYGKVIAKTREIKIINNTFNYILFPLSGEGNYRSITVDEIKMKGRSLMKDYIKQNPNEPKTVFEKNGFRFSDDI